MTNQTTTSGEPIATCMYCRSTAGNHVVNCPCRDDILVGTNSLLYDEILLKNAKIKTMKANLKAKELKAKFGNLAGDVVNEILTQLKQDVTPHEPETINGKLIGVKYWQEIKKEL